MIAKACSHTGSDLNGHEITMSLSILDKAKVENLGMEPDGVPEMSCNQIHLKWFVSVLYLLNQSESDNDTGGWTVVYILRDCCYRNDHFTKRTLQPPIQFVYEALAAVEQI